MVLINLYDKCISFQKEEPDSDKQLLYHDTGYGNLGIDKSLLSFQLDLYTQYILRFIDMDNVLVVGDSVTIPLRKLPENIDSTDPTAIRCFYYNQYPESNINLCIYDLDTDEQYKKKLRSIVKSVRNYIPYTVSLEHSCTNNSVRIRSGKPYRDVVIKLCKYKSVEEVLEDTSLDCCSVGYDGKTVHFTDRGYKATVTQCNYIDLTNITNQNMYELELHRYGIYGFSVSLPDFIPDLKAVDPHTYTCCTNIQIRTGFTKLLLLDYKNRGKELCFGSVKLDWGYHKIIGVDTLKFTDIKKKSPVKETDWFDDSIIITEKTFRLHRAVTTHDNKTVARTVKKYGRYINHKDVTGRTPLYLAVQFDNLEATDILLGADCDISVAGPDSLNPFEKSCELGYLEQVELLYDYITDMGTVDRYLNSMKNPINLAVKNNHTSVFTFLWNLKETVKSSLILDTCLESSCNPNVLDTIVKDLDDVPYKTVYQAIETKKYELLPILLQNPSKITNMDHNILFHLLPLPFDIFKKIYVHFIDKINIVDKTTGKTVLDTIKDNLDELTQEIEHKQSYIDRYNLLDIYKYEDYVQKQKINDDQINELQDELNELRSTYRDLDSKERSLRLKGAFIRTYQEKDIVVQKPEENLGNEFYNAVWQEDVDTVKTLVQTCETDRTVVQISVLRDDIDTLSILLENSDLHTFALEQAVENNSINSVKYLLKTCDDIEVSSNLLVTSIVKEHLDIAQLLLKQGYSVGSYDNLVKTVAQTGTTRGLLFAMEYVPKLVKKYHEINLVIESNVLDDRGNTVLHYLVSEDRSDVLDSVRVVLKLYPDIVNQKNNDSVLPIHRSINNKNSLVFQLLVENGSETGNCLEDVVWNGTPDMLSLLSRTTKDIQSNLVELVTTVQDPHMFQKVVSLIGRDKIAELTDPETGDTLAHQLAKNKDLDRLTCIDMNNVENCEGKVPWEYLTVSDIGDLGLDTSGLSDRIYYYSS